MSVRTTREITTFESDLEARGITAGHEVAPYEIDRMAPAVVTRPSTVDQLAAVLGSAQRHGLAVSPTGGRTRLSIGNAPRAYDVAVDMTGLNRVIAHNHADLTATVEAGVTFAALQQRLSAQGQMVAIDPPLPTLATVGGTLAVGTAGPLKWQYLHPRDLVIGMKVVQADGTVTKSGGQVVKNVSGYDMSRLHIGGLGTIGVIAEVSFKLTPLPVREATLIVDFPSADDAVSAGLAVFRSAVMPLAITCFGPSCTRLAVRMGGRPAALARQVDECARHAMAAGATGLETMEGESAAGLWRGLSDFGWDGDTPALAMRASVTPSNVAALIHSVADGTVAPEMVAHPAHGTVQILWRGPMDDVQAFGKASQVRAAAAAMGGSAVIERCSSSMKASFDVWGEVGSSIETMRRLKSQFDPNGSLNLGRFAGGI